MRRTALAASALTVASAVGLLAAGAGAGVDAGAAPTGALASSPLPGSARAAAVPAPRQPAPSERIERMLDNRLACRGCHVVAGRGGRIGPPLDGVGERLERERVRSMILDPAGTIPGTLMPPQRVPARDLEALVDHLVTLPVGDPSAAPGAAPPPLPDGTVDGAALYARHCAACHGEGGRGDGWNAPSLPVPPTPHASAERMSTRLDDALYDAISAGAFVLDGSPLMPAYGDALTPPQIRALVGHIRTLCACAQPAWASGP